MRSGMDSVSTHQNMDASVVHDLLWAGLAERSIADVWAISRAEMNANLFQYHP